MNVNQEEKSQEVKVEKYPTDKTYRNYYSTKYWARVKNTTHCYEKNIAKGVILLPVDTLLFGFNIIGAIAMNLAYIVA